MNCDADESKGDKDAVKGYMGTLFKEQRKGNQERRGVIKSDGEAIMADREALNSDKNALMVNGDALKDD